MDSKTMNRLAELEAAMSASVNDKKSFRGAIYGPSGAGKSDLAIEIMDKIVAPDMGILIVDTSENWVVLGNRIERGLTPDHTFMHLPFTYIEDIRIMSEGIASGAGMLGHIGGIILDEASSMSEDDLDRFYEQRRAGIEAGTLKTPSDGIPDTPDWADYRPALQRFRSMITQLSRIQGLHIILVAHEKQDSKTKYISPSFSPMIGKKIKEPLHLVGRLIAKITTKPGEENASYVREIQIHPTLGVDAKSRLGVQAVRFDAGYLAQGIKDWLGAGAVESDSEEVIAKDPSPMQEVVANMTTAEALEVADEFVMDDADLGSFDPIS